MTPITTFDGKEYPLFDSRANLPAYGEFRVESVENRRISSFVRRIEVSRSACALPLGQMLAIADSELRRAAECFDAQLIRYSWGFVEVDANSVLNKDTRSQRLRIDNYELAAEVEVIRRAETSMVARLDLYGNPKYTLARRKYVSQTEPGAWRLADADARQLIDGTDPTGKRAIYFVDPDIMLVNT